MAKQFPLGADPGPCPRILAVATAAPDHVLEQAFVRDLAGPFFGRKFKDIDRLLPIFDHTGIVKRHLAQPLEWYLQPRSFPEVCAVHEVQALDLSRRAAAAALGRAGLAPEEVGAVVLVCSTGVSTPTLETKLIQALGLPAQTVRLPIFGLGCAGGAAGLARAAELALARPGQAVLLVAVELCSLTFQRGDLSKSNLVAVSLFGDGAAAALVRLGETGPALLGGFSHLFPDSAGVMGWDMVETGFKVRFAQSIPALVLDHVPELVAAAAQAWGLDRAEIRRFVCHPGGTKVLQAYAEGLGLAEADLAEARAVLRDYGNMSSPSVLFVLERFLGGRPPQGEFGLLLALGPGFCAEQVLFRW